MKNLQHPDKLIYIHGGPGLCSEFERQALTPKFNELGTEILFWNQPKASSDSRNVFQNSVDSIEQFIASQTLFSEKIHLILHSFAGHYLNFLKHETLKRVSGVTIISPVFHLDLSHRNILGLAIDDFESLSDHKKVFQLSQLLEKADTFFDSYIEKGCEIALEDPLLFSHYWQKAENLQRFIEIYSQPSFAFSPDTFFKTLSDLRDLNISSQNYKNVEIPTLFIFGDQDPVVDSYKEASFASTHYNQSEVFYFKECGHWPHIESMSRFIEVHKEKWQLAR